MVKGVVPEEQAREELAEEGLDLTNNEDEVAIPQDTEVEELGKTLRDNVGALTEKARKEQVPVEEPPADEEPTEENTRPEAPARDATGKFVKPEAAAPVATEDPELDLGERYGKHPRSIVEQRLQLADRAEQLWPQFQAREAKVKEKEALFADLGGLAGFAETVKSYGPHAPALKEAVLQTIRQFKANLDENPAMVAFAHQISPLERQVKELQAQLAAQAQQRDQWFMQQTEAKIADRIKRHNRKFAPAQVLKAAAAVSMEPDAFMDMNWGPDPGNVVEASQPGTAAAGKPWDRAKPAAAPGPKSVAPGGTKAASVDLNALSPEELMEYAKRNVRKVVRGFPRTNLGSETE